MCMIFKWGEIMAKENVFEPELSRVKSDEYYLFYEMMLQALRTDNVKEGLNKSLFLLKMYLQSGNIALYKKNSDGQYVFRLSDTNMGELLTPVSSIINKAKTLLEQKEIFSMDLDLSDRLRNLKFIHMDVDGNDVLMVVNNYRNKNSNDNHDELDEHFWERLKDTMLIILKRAASYEKNTKAFFTDLLTGLENRNCYEVTTQHLNKNQENLVFGIFDLFRLKYVNDNYSHDKGDEYIKKVANILKKYWPKEKATLNADGTETSVSTGHCVFRVGGDEFILLTNKEDIELTNIKAKLAAEEVSLLDLNVGENLPIGINYGVVKHIPGDSLKHTYVKADNIMQEDKLSMYTRNGLERRR